MEKKIYITPLCKVHTYSVLCMDTITQSGTTGSPDDTGLSKGTGSGSNIWDDFDDNFENK